MKTVLHKASSRGGGHHGWLQTYHTFSFADYYDPARMGFGALRVLNDDTVAPGTGFDTHPHRNMEVVSIPLSGKMIHGDSLQNRNVIGPGDIQVMSTGTGIFHSEHNYSHSEVLEFLQIWILPRRQNTEPRYTDYDIRSLVRPNELSLFISPDGETPAAIGQDAWFSWGALDAGIAREYRLHREKGTGVYLFVVEGTVRVADYRLNRRDGIGIWDTRAFAIEAVEKSEVLLIEIPMQKKEQ